MNFKKMIDTDMGRTMIAIAVALPMTAALMVGAFNILDAATSSMMF